MGAFFNRATAAVAALMSVAGRSVSSLPRVAQHRHGAPRPKGINMYNLSWAGRRAARSKQYPHSSTRQQRRDAKKMVTVRWNRHSFMNQMPAFLYLSDKEVDQVLNGENK